MDDNAFRIWAYEMYDRNREERFNYKQENITFDEYYKNNLAWLKLKYEELKEKGI
jgi:hypothetical protein